MNIIKTRMGTWLRVYAVILLLVPAGAAWAQWELDTTESSVNFVSIKNDSVAELHSFTSLQGHIGADGKAQVTINLDSVETLIDIRNERMREMLFETADFPLARIAATVDPAVLAAVVDGGSLATDLPLTLALHGVEKSLIVPLVILGEGAGRIRVFTPGAAIVSAADFGLEAGVAALQAVAGLKAISTAVPVTVHLVFNRAQ